MRLSHRAQGEAWGNNGYRTDMAEHGRIKASNSTTVHAGHRKEGLVLLCVAAFLLLPPVCLASFPSTFFPYLFLSLNNFNLHFLPNL